MTRRHLLKTCAMTAALCGALFWTSHRAGAAPATDQHKQDRPPSPLASETGALLSVATIPAFLRDSIGKMKGELANRYGDQKQRIDQGIQQVAAYWRAEDGDAAAFESFIRDNYVADPAQRDELFNRLQFALEQLDGHMHEISREFRRQTDLDLGPILPIDDLLAGYDPSAHILDDFFANKAAFIVLLNFPLTTLEQRMTEGEKWSRRQWAEIRLAQRFSRRVPADVQLEISNAASNADRYISEYNIWMHHLLDEEGKRLFPPKLRLISHWNLRDEIKAAYSDPAGLPKQRMIQKVMDHIVTQTIPAVAINNPHVDWKPVSNKVMLASASDTDVPAPGDLRVIDAPEPNTRYAQLLSTFNAVRKADAFSPTAPSLIARRFNENRELPEERVKAMLEAVVSSPLVARVGKVIATRLGRKLEPFDVWYNGFRPRGAYTEEQLDQMVAKRYPDIASFEKDIPNLLQRLGFARDRAEYLASNIVVDPSRGAGHAMGASRRQDKAHLRTRFEKGGMNYKGFNIAIHEMGHNCEQTFSLNDIDYTLLEGVPNTAFTEALAFVFQGHDLELLGLPKPDATARALITLNDFWATYEIAGVALVDMAVWHWMYDHPDATPAALRDATVQISKEIWNKYYAPVFGKKDVVLLGVYSHMIDAMLYLPDYPIGHMIAFQIEEQMERAGNLGREFERMARIGSVTPDLWMKQATGAPVGPDPLLRAAEKALKQINAH